MINKYSKDIRWDSLSRIVIICFFVLQIVRWKILPQFMDIYYHFSTAWGFLQAGGYSGWDFWQYAPVGRPHIYPPLFHIILAALIKLGADKIILAKIFETISPVAFLLVIWFFTARHYSKRLGFFVLLSAVTSYSFYMSLINHIPASLAIVFAFFSLGQLLQNKFLRAALFLALSFYTHIGIPWFFALGIFLYGLVNKNIRKGAFYTLIFAILLSAPVIFKQLLTIRFIARTGFNLSERFICQFKIIEYVLALIGLALAIRKRNRYYLFLSLFLASLIFLIYPYRFFSAEGYLPIIFLSAVTLEALYNKLKLSSLYLRYAVVLLLTFYVFFVSPTIIMDRADKDSKVQYKLLFSHTPFMELFSPEKKSRGFFNYIWFAYSPEEYLSGAKLIAENSQDDDIVYCNLNLLGLCLSSLSGRPTANGLFPEINPVKKFDPYAVAKIVILPKDNKPEYPRIVDYYKLQKIGETKLFVIYKNTFPDAKMQVRPVSVPFWWLGIASCLFVALYLKK